MIGALIGIGLLSLLAGVASTYYTNLQTSKLADQANGLQYTQFLQSQDFNQNERIAAQQYNTQERLEAQQFNVGLLKEQQLYNSPVAQSQRLRDAGINPASVIGGDGNVSTVQSSPASVSGASSPGIPGQIVPSMENLFQPNMTTGLLDSVMSALDKREDIIGKNTDNQTRVLRNKAEIEKMIAEKESLLASKKLTKAQTKSEWQSLQNLRVQKTILDNEATMSKIRADKTDQLIQNEFNKYQLEREKFDFERDSTKIAQGLAERGMIVNERLAQNTINKTMQELSLMRKEGKKIDSEIALNRLRRNGLVLQNSNQALQNRKLSAEIPSQEIEGLHAQRTLDSMKNDNSIPAEAWKFIDQMVWYVLNNGASLLKYMK